MTLTKIQADQTAFTPSGTGAIVRTIDSKLEDTISPLDYGAVGNGTTDDVTALQAAINAAEAIVGPRTGATDIEAAYAVVDLGGRKYSISNSLTISEAIVLQNGAIVASSTFPINNYCINIADTAERAVIQRVDIDGGLYTATRRGNGIKVNAPRVHISRVYVNHFPQFGIRVFTSASVTTQEVRIENCLVREWQFTEAGTTTFSLRTAKGISIEVADNYVINTTVAQCLTPLYLSGALNIIDGCHFYNGGASSSTPVVVELDNTDNTVFSGCYFDNGTIDIKTSFNHNITGCHFQKTASCAITKFIQTFTSATNETVQGLIVTGCNFNGSFVPITFETTGSGSYVSDVFKKMTWLGNYRVDGGDVWVQAKFGVNAYLEDGNMYLTQNNNTFNFKAIQGITLDADYDNNSPASESFVEIKTDGNSKFKFISEGDLEPQNVNYTIATGNISSNTITSNAHGLATGQALFYVSNGTNLITSAGTAADETQFFVIKVNDNSFKLASSLANATADPVVPLNITGTGNNLQVFRTSTARVGNFSKPLNTVFTNNVSLKPVSQPPNMEGRLYYDSTANKLKFYNGTAWETITSS